MDIIPNRRPVGYGIASPVFTVDVEDWFQVTAFESHVSRSDWSRLESRVERNTDLLLQVCADTGISGTFFTLGWVADQYPSLVRRIVDAGHEIASHGYWHQRIPSITANSFREDVRRAKQSLEDVIGGQVTGYRAPSFSLTDAVPWAAEILVEEGHLYDSSRFPVRRPGYGTSRGDRHPYVIRTPAGQLDEYPPAVWAPAGVHVPVAGGGWFRQFPSWLVNRGFQSVIEESQPAVFYLHPWEVDPEQPRLRVDFITRTRHYRGLKTCEQRLRRLIRRFPGFRSLRALRSDSLHSTQS